MVHHLLYIEQTEPWVISGQTEAVAKILDVAWLHRIFDEGSGTRSCRGFVVAWSTLSKNIRQVPAHFPGDRMDEKIVSEASIAFHNSLRLRIQPSHSLIYTCAVSCIWSRIDSTEPGLRRRRIRQGIRIHPQRFSSSEAVVSISSVSFSDCIHTDTGAAGLFGPTLGYGIQSNVRRLQGRFSPVKNMIRKAPAAWYSNTCFNLGSGGHS